LLGDHRGVRPRVVCDQLVEKVVGVRLEPEHLARGRRLPWALVERVQAGIGGDLVEPGPEWGAARVRVPPAPRTQERLLDQVLRFLEGAEHAVAVDVQLAPVALDLLAEGRLVERGIAVRGGHACVTAAIPQTNRSGEWA